MQVTEGDFGDLLDPEALAVEMRRLPSNAAFRLWHEALGRANVACSEIDVAEKELATLQLHVQKLRRRDKAALASRGQLAPLYTTLQPRLCFNIELPEDINCNCHTSLYTSSYTSLYYNCNCNCNYRMNMALTIAITTTTEGHCCSHSRWHWIC